MQPAIREYVTMLFRQAMLASLGEGSIVAGVSKPTVLRWLIEAQIDWRAARLRYLAKHHVKSEQRAAREQHERRRDKIWRLLRKNRAAKSELKRRRYHR